MTCVQLVNEKYLDIQMFWNLIRGSIKFHLKDINVDILHYKEMDSLLLVSLLVSLHSERQIQTVWGHVRKKAAFLLHWIQPNTWLSTSSAAAVCCTRFTDYYHKTKQFYQCSTS